MPDGTVLIYLYDGTFDGLLSAVFESYAKKERPDDILEPRHLQYGFGQAERDILTDEAKALRVERGLIEKIGHPAYRSAWIAFLSGNPGKAAVVYRYIRACFSQGRRIYTNLAHPDVLALHNLKNPIDREVGKYLGFVRFSRMENGVYYGRISPQNNVIPLLMPHFSDRFSDRPFLLHDDVRGLAGVYAGAEWYLAETKDVMLPDYAEEEFAFRLMWKRFHEALTIRERINPGCQRNNMPKRYWNCMTEMCREEGRESRKLREKKSPDSLRSSHRVAIE